MPMFKLDIRAAAPQIRKKVLPAALLAALAVPGASASTLVVNSPGDDVTPGDGLVTLREAIAAANTDQATDLGDSGSGADVIDLTGLAGTITLTSVLPVVASDVTIAGPGRATLTITGSSGNGAADSGIFFVWANGALHVQDLTLSGGTSQGGHGGNVPRDGGGGGAAGAGGAVFVNGGGFTATGVNFSGNIARGGAGGATNGPYGIFYSGGGGGFGEDVRDVVASPPYGIGTDGGNGGPFGTTGGLAGTSGSLGYAQSGGAGAGGGDGGTGIATKGGNGGFLGGGGGANWAFCGAGPAGLGGYGGGGGGGDLCNYGGYVKAFGGAGGTFGGKGGAGTNIGFGNGGGGGGGAGLGGALFAATGSTVTLANCTFDGNQAQRGAGGSAGANGLAGQDGHGKGGAIFLMSGVSAAGDGVFFANNAADDADNALADNADYYGSLALSQGRQIGFGAAQAGVDATKTITLHLLLPVVTSNGSNTAVASSVDYSTSDGSAQAGTDYQATSGTITIPQNTPSGFPFAIDVPLLNPSGVHGPTTFTITLSNFSSLFPGNHVVEAVTIVGNDTLFRSDFDGDGL